MENKNVQMKTQKAFAPVKFLFWISALSKLQCEKYKRNEVENLSSAQYGHCADICDTVLFTSDEYAKCAGYSDKFQNTGPPEAKLNNSLLYIHMTYLPPFDMQIYQILGLHFGSNRYKEESDEA
ncbi:hypothetical protein MG293_007088 [Ovis ammon polii]|uniref:Uncharacterized protein n=1 Tax=Ovis ammon polii TaxID=230172 RepID=A0AAD4UE69_OVIAM|nr:hypothetical protein MG293_007088 [Ovis ammon polii]